MNEIVNTAFILLMNIIFLYNKTVKNKMIEYAWKENQWFGINVTESICNSDIISYINNIIMK